MELFALSSNMLYYVDKSTVR